MEPLWCKYLIVKNIGQGKKCRICSGLAEERRKEPTKEGKAEITERLNQHCEENKADRNTAVHPLPHLEHLISCL